MKTGKLPDSVVAGSDNVDTALDTVGSVGSTIQHFLDKVKVVGDKLEFVVRAVDAIAEVCSVSVLITILECELRLLFCRFTHTPKLLGV